MFAAALVLAVGPATVASAHDGEPPLRVTEPEVRPGGTIELVGDLSSAGAVEVHLRAADPTWSRSLGVVEADDLGHFQAFVAVPIDVPSGDYLVVATNDLGSSGVELTVAGPPVDTDEAGQLPGRDEALAGGATDDPATVPSVATVPSPAGAADATASAGIDPVPFAAATLAIVALALLATRSGPRRPTR